MGAGEKFHLLHLKSLPCALTLGNHKLVSKYDKDVEQQINNLLIE